MNRFRYGIGGGDLSRPARSSPTSRSYSVLREAWTSGRSAGNRAGAIQTARSYSRSLRNDLQFTVDAVKNTLNGLAGVDGRKIFVYVSEGLPSTAGAELFDQIQRKFQGSSGGATLEQFEFDMNSQYARIIQAANSQNVTI